MGGGGSSRNRFAFSDGPTSFGGALSNLGEALKVGEAGVALEVDELAPLKYPLCTPLSVISVQLVLQLKSTALLRQLKLVFFEPTQFKGPGIEKH